MVERAVATKLVLRQLAEPEDISSLDDRKRLQKLIYLAQAAGVGLGYGFSWYLKGPYSSSLAKDYYNMPPVDLGAQGAPSLKPELVPLLNKVKGVLTDERRPDNLGSADWLEIVASVHYLERVFKLDRDAANAKLAREKPLLVGYADTARHVLETYYPSPQAH